jgi:integrase
LREVNPAFLTEELEKLRARTSPRTGQKLAGRTVGIWFAIVRAALSYAVEQRALATNPALKLGRPDDETESPEARWLTEGEVKKFLAAAASDAPELYGYFRLLAETGMRPAEGAALQWSDLNLKGRRVTIRSAVVRLNDGWAVVPHTKTHAIGTLGVSPSTARALERHRAQQAMLKLKHGARYDDQGLVFANEIGQLYIPSNLSKRFRDLADAAKLPPECTLYSLRHSAATHRLHRKQDPVSVAKVLRHKSTALVYKTYGHAIPDEKQAQLTDTLGLSYGDHATG